MNERKKEMVTLVSPYRKLMGIEFKGFEDKIDGKSIGSILRRDWIEITEPTLFDDEGMPNKNSPIDLRLGALFGFRCRTCWQRVGKCNGHFGYVKLPGFEKDGEWHGVMNPLFGEPMKYLVVLPNVDRKIVEVFDNVKFDDVTLGYVTVLNILHKHGVYRGVKLPDIIYDEMIEVLQHFVDLIFENRKGVTKKGSNEPVMGIIDGLKGKQGHLRKLCLGKRTNNAARAVFTTDPDLGVDECGVPKEIADVLEVTEHLSPERVKDDAYFEVLDIETGFRFRKEIWVKSQKNIQLMRKEPERFKGVRHLRNRDLVLYGRQPSLHRMSILAGRAVVDRVDCSGRDLKVFSLNPVVCGPLNADSDGDVLWFAVPGSDEAREEAYELMLASKNIVSPRHGQDVIVNQQDLRLLEYVETGGVKEKKDVSDLEHWTSGESLRKLTMLGVTYSDDWMKMITTTARSRGGPFNYGQMYEKGPVAGVEPVHVPGYFDVKEGEFDACLEKGLSPTAFWEHASQGRMSMADTKLMTPKTGYMQRKMIFALGDMRWHEKDGQVKDAVGRVISDVRLGGPDFSKPSESMGKDGVCHRSDWVAKDGEYVGVICAQSLGEASTQTALRSFHRPGTLHEEIKGFNDLNRLVCSRTGLEKEELLAALVEFFEGQDIVMDRRWLMLLLNAKFVGDEERGLGFGYLDLKSPLQRLGFERVRRALKVIRGQRDWLDSPFAQVITGVYK